MGRHWVDRALFCFVFLLERRAIAGGLKITALVIPFSATKNKKTICAFPPKIALVGGRCLKKSTLIGGWGGASSLYSIEKKGVVSHAGG